VFSISGLRVAAIISEREKSERDRERRASEKGAAEARFHLAAIVESSDDAIISKDLNGIILSWNAAAQRILGFREAEAVRQPITIIIPPELLGEEKLILQTVKAGKQIEHSERTRLTKTGKKVDVSLTISPLKDASGKIVGASTIARDICERKRAQDTLKKSEEKFSSE
jgi:PAS domain S-box-containing protein